MSRKQDKQRSSRMCAICNKPSGKRRTCAHCNPRRPTRTHTDKYAAPTDY